MKERIKKHFIPFVGSAAHSVVAVIVAFAACLLLVFSANAVMTDKNGENTESVSPDSSYIDEALKQEIEKTASESAVSEVAQ